MSEQVEKVFEKGAVRDVAIILELSTIKGTVEKSGIKLMQYFDWHDKKIFMSMVKSKLNQTSEKIYAKKTVLKEIGQPEANEFLKENHLLGGARGQSLCVGLFHNDELVHVQTYGKAFNNKNFEWEAIKSASKLNTRVVGAVSKCDSYFFEKINPESVVSYVDLSTSQGETVSMSDMWEFSHISVPSVMWVKFRKTENNLNSPMFIKDSSVRRASAPRMLKLDSDEFYSDLGVEGSGVTNESIMLSEGYVKVYDCGTKVFRYRRSA